MLINKDSHKYVARIIIELKSPLAIGSGVEDEIKGALVLKDWNELPYIPGTSLLGVLRSHFTNALELKNIFGFASEKSYEDQSEDVKYLSRRARVYCSSGLVLDSKGKAHESIIPQTQIEGDQLLSALSDLPIRDHVKIGHEGVGISGAKFQEELVYTGTRFAFILELDGTVTKEENELERYWRFLLQKIQSPTFLLGGKTTNGFGQIEVIKIEEKLFDFRAADDVQLFASIKSFQSDFGKLVELNQHTDETYDRITHEVDTDSFLIVADQDPKKSNNKLFKKEEIIHWDNNNSPTIIDRTLIPGTSIKGVLAHRVAFHWNKEQNRTVEFMLKKSMKELTMENLTAGWIPEDARVLNRIKALSGITFPNEKDVNELKELRGKLLGLKVGVARHFDLNNFFNDYLRQQKNEAVRDIFGYVDEEATEEQIGAMIGKVIVEDCYLDNITRNSKQFMHVAIDCYSGEGIDRALFSEEALHAKKIKLVIKIKKNLGENRRFLDLAIQDIISGITPVGGLTNKGHGLLVASGKSKIQSYKY